MLVFVTVGSTRFDALVQAAISEQVLHALHAKGYRQIVIQRGNSDFGINGQDLMVFEKNGMEVETWKFKPTILPDIQRADLIVSHAGSGTILDVLRQGKPMIVAPNPTLLDDHQGELSSKLDALGYLTATTVNNLAATISTFDPSSLIPFPPFDGSRFRRLIDQEMGYSVDSS
ncbi:glycosyl transferase [Pisolithus marmoratus]|nr:glycosyl transferase [Pisolithus marmoratus]